MSSKRLSLTTVALLVLALAGSTAYVLGEDWQDQDLFNQGKILMFDKNWEDAYGLFQQFIRQFPRSPLVPQAYFFKARCLQLQRRNKDALPDYEEFLDKFPNEPILPAEARNAVVEIAASLFEKGDPVFKDRITSALSSAIKDVRYFTAIRCAYLKDNYLKSMIVPVLKEILRNEDESDLVDRARIRLMRLDPKALSENRESRSRERTKQSSDTKMFHLEVYVDGQSEPTVELNIPVALAQLAMNALDESAKREIRRKGIDIDNIFETLKNMGPTDILTFRDGENVVKIWIR